MPSEFGIFELCGSLVWEWEKAAEFLKSETLRYPTSRCEAAWVRRF
jgi:hypothetical protein